ncbi:hypothetical protein N324_09730, partial [Chlamydotis macqueenii]
GSALLNLPESSSWLPQSPRGCWAGVRPSYRCTAR